MPRARPTPRRPRPATQLVPRVRLDQLRPVEKANLGIKLAAEEQPTQDGQHLDVEQVGRMDTVGERIEMRVVHLAANHCRDHRGCIEHDHRRPASTAARMSSRVGPLDRSRARSRAATAGWPARRAATTGPLAESGLALLRTVLDYEQHRALRVAEVGDCLSPWHGGGGNHDVLRGCDRHPIQVLHVEADVDGMTARR